MMEHWGKMGKNMGNTETRAENLLLGKLWENCGKFLFFFSSSEFMKGGLFHLEVPKIGMCVEVLNFWVKISVFLVAMKTTILKI